MTAFTVEDLIGRLEHLQARGPVPFDVKGGEILGILCTGDLARQTLIEILTVTLFPLPSFAEHSQFAILGNLGDVRRNMGVVFPEPVLDPARTVRENLDHHARLHGLDDETRERRIAGITELFDIAGDLDVTVETCSPVMARRLEIARAYLSHPVILFLATPTEGLNGSDSREIRSLLRNLNRKRGVTIVFTTHDVDEAAAVCARIAVMDQKGVVALDTPDALRSVMALDDTPVGSGETL